MSNGLELRTLQQLLEAQGLNMSALTDPGARYGYGMGTSYGNLFQPFDVDAYQQSAEALLGLEESLMGGIEEQFGAGGRKVRGGLQSALQKIQEMGRPSGLVGGARQRLATQARRGASQSFEELIGKTEQQRISTQEQLGRQAAQLEGSFTSFLGDTVSRYLQVLQADPNEAPALSAPLMTTEDYGINLPEFSNFNFDIYGGNQSG
jgi:hypothetical protein